MKEITLPVSELKAALPGLAKIVGRARCLPVLQSVRIARSAEGHVSIQATDLDSCATYRFQAQAGPPLALLMPLEPLAKAVKGMKAEGDIGLLPEGKDKLKLRYTIAGNLVEQNVATLPVVEFPPEPAVHQPGVALAPGFGLALRQALECCSEDSSRYILNGACLDVTDQQSHYVVATNGRELYSANSFSFGLKKSVVIPDSKFLAWPDFLDEAPAILSVEPGEEAQPAGHGKPAQEGRPAWLKLQSGPWTFVTKEREGTYPNWKQCIPTPNGQWTQVMLSDEAIAQMLLIIPNLPGHDSLNHTVRLRVDRCLNLEGQNRDDETWTSIPVSGVNITGDPVTIGLNRDYLLQALRFGLNRFEIEQSLTPIVCSKGGKKMVIMPVNLEASKPQAPPADPTPAENPPAASPSAPAVATPTETERTNMSETMPRGNLKTHTNGNEESRSTFKAALEQLDQVKTDLRQVLSNLNNTSATLKAAEKEQRASHKEIETVRVKLREIQSVAI